MSFSHHPVALGTAGNSPLSPAIDAGGTVFISGQLGSDPTTREIPSGVAEQTRNALDRIGTLLAEAGLDFRDVVKTTVFVSSVTDLAAVNTVYSTYFDTPLPARSAVQVVLVRPEYRVEIEAIAVRG